MRTRLTLLCALLSCLALAESVRVEWDYPADEIADVTFHLYQSSTLSLPVAEWQHIAAVNETFVRLNVEPGKHFFTVSASNLWGQVFSEITNSPVVPRSAGPMRIAKE